MIILLTLLQLQIEAGHFRLSLGNVLNFDLTKLPLSSLLVSKAVAHIKMVINYWSGGLGLLGNRGVSVEYRVILVDVLAKPRDLLFGPTIPFLLIYFTLLL